MAFRSVGARVSTYAILVVGAIIFSFPFLWLASTSMKLDRELFTGRIDMAPERPRPRLHSPYYDERHYRNVELTVPQFNLLKPLLMQRVEEWLPASPVAADGATPRDLLVAGLFDSLARRTPPSVWNGDEQKLIEYAAKDVTPERVGMVAGACYRELRFGSLRARSSGLEEIELTPPPISSRWKIPTPRVARLADRSDGSLQYAAAAYDFELSDRFALEQVFELPFDSSDLHRLQLRVCPDDTWHEVQLTLDAAGVRYEAARHVAMADSRWTTLTWQKPSADDASTKIKSWVVLRPIERGKQFDLGRRAIRVTLTVRRVAPVEALFAKARYNYQRVLEHIPFWRYVRVSVVLVLLNIVLTLLSSSLVAYAFARLAWPGRDGMFLVLLGTMMIPGQVTMIPHFLIWKNLGAYDTLVPLWAGAAMGNAFLIFLMRQFLRGIPRDLEDAARIDGCGFLRIYWHVMLPLVKPSLAAIAIFTFIGTWNDFLGPLIYIADQRLYPLAFGLYAFAVQVGSNPVLTMAAGLLMTVPVIAVFFAAQRYFIQGVTLTGMKG